MQRGADVALRGMDVCPIPDLLAGFSNRIEELASLRIFTGTSTHIGLGGEAEANVGDRPLPAAGARDHDSREIVRNASSLQYEVLTQCEVDRAFPLCLRRAGFHLDASVPTPCALYAHSRE